MRERRVFTVSHFYELFIEHIEFVTFYDDEGFLSHYNGELFQREISKILKETSFRFAFVNMIGGEFFLVKA